MHVMLPYLDFRALWLLLGFWVGGPDGGGGLILRALSELMQLQKVGHLEILVGHHLGPGPKAICKASGGVPPYNMVNFNMTITRPSRTLISKLWGSHWDFEWEGKM